MRLLLTILFSCFLTSILAQEKGASPKKIEALASEHFRIDDFTNALIYYKQLDSMQPGVGKTNFRIGYCIFNTAQKTKSLPYFQKAKQAAYEDPDLELYLARSLHLNHQFDAAMEAYKRYSPDPAGKKLTPEEEEELSRGEREIKEIKTDVSRYMAMCETGKKLMADSLTLVIENMGPVINSPYPDYVPVVSADESELIFTSRRPNTTGGNKDPQDKHYFEDVYICTKEANGEWGTPKNMGPSVNSPLHDASVGVSPDGKQLFIYRAEFTKKQTGDIFQSTLDSNGWSTPVKMGGHINSDYWEPSASISKDEKTFFVSSNRPGGFGGTDIYIVRLGKDSVWEEPVNMGALVNTAFDEDAPYIHPDNKTLFFSSRGHNTMGGFDIFTTTLKTVSDTIQEWSTPENAGYPINTADDDIYFIWSADGTKGYFSSWRDDSYGEKDLYVIHKPKRLVLKGNVYDNVTRLPLQSSLTIKDAESNTLIGVYTSDTLGYYELPLPPGSNYSITAKAEGYVFQSSNINIDQQSEVRKDIYLDPVKEGQAVVLNNIFFDFDLATLRPESEPELENLYSFLMKYPELRVEFSGHTDSFGSERYNARLSQRRAKAVVDYLQAKGISKSRMLSKGHGESHPREHNDTDEGRQINRRTELLILDSKHNYLLSYNNISIRYKNEFKGQIAASGRSGAKQHTEHDQSTAIASAETNVAYTKPQATSETPETTSHLSNTSSQDTRTSFYSGVEYRRGDKYFLPLQAPKADALLKPKVHFIYNESAALTQYSTDRVREIAEILKTYPTTNVKLVAYADASGSSTMTQLIAEKRLATVQKILIKNGIDASRIKTEVKPLDAAALETGNPESDIHNRRIEFITSE